MSTLWSYCRNFSFQKSLRHLASGTCIREVLLRLQPGFLCSFTAGWGGKIRQFCKQHRKQGPQQFQLSRIGWSPSLCWGFIASHPRITTPINWGPASYEDLFRGSRRIDSLLKSGTGPRALHWRVQVLPSTYLRVSSLPSFYLHSCFFKSNYLPTIGVLWILRDSPWTLNYRIKSTIPSL